MLIPARVLYIGRFAHQLDKRHSCCQLIKCVSSVRKTTAREEPMLSQVFNKSRILPDIVFRRCWAFSVVPF